MQCTLKSADMAHPIYAVVKNIKPYLWQIWQVKLAARPRVEWGESLGFRPYISGGYMEYTDCPHRSQIWLNIPSWLVTQRKMGNFQASVYFPLDSSWHNGVYRYGTFRARQKTLIHFICIWKTKLCLSSNPIHIKLEAVDNGAAKCGWRSESVTELEMANQIWP